MYYYIVPNTQKYRTKISKDVVENILNWEIKQMRISSIFFYSEDLIKKNHEKSKHFPIEKW